MLSRIEREGWDVVGVHGVPNKATGGVRVESDHEKECEMVGIPEGLETLIADFMMGGSVHEEHDKEHEMTSDTASLSVMNVESPFLANLWIKT